MLRIYATLIAILTMGDAPANTKRLLKALIDREVHVAPAEKISQVAAQIGLDEGKIRRAIACAKAQGWFEVTKMGGSIKDWLSITPSGKAAVKS
jgi:2-hydroxychromene-2-carboxylate isomerase